MATCSVDQCKTDAVARGWCPKHWWRWRHYGTTESRARPLEQRFWSKVEQRGRDECWAWLATIKKDTGRPAFAVRRTAGEWQTVHAAVVAYQLTHGPVPDGLEVHHDCFNPQCVNPGHLRAVPGEENRALGDGRTACRRGGHPFNEVNSYIGPNGKRRCRPCAAEDQRARRRARSVS